MSVDLSRWADKVHHADCLDVLRELPDCSVHLCATDPPYALTSGTGASGGFLGKAWDAALPARAIWAEVLRVLKPGASCFVCAGSRQDTILGLLTDLREVGFDIQHAALSWVYFAGMPKSTSVSKQCDKAAFLAWLRETPEGETETRQALMGWDAADVRKAASAAVNGAYENPLARKIEESGSTYSKLSQGTIGIVPDRSHGTLLLAALQARFGDAPGVRAKVGTKPDPRYAHPRDTAVFHLHDYDDGSTAGTGSGEDHPAATITAPSTPDAIAWDGWHSGSVPLKPSAEQILWVTKPAEPGPARDNVLKWGVGACNIGECRVPWDKSGLANALVSTRPHTTGWSWEPGENIEDQSTHQGGRYPSNLLVTARALGDDSKYGDLDQWLLAYQHRTGTSQDCELTTDSDAFAVDESNIADRDRVLQLEALAGTPHTPALGLAMAYCDAVFGRSSWPVSAETTKPYSNCRTDPARDARELLRILDMGSEFSASCARCTRRTCQSPGASACAPDSMTAPIDSQDGCLTYRHFCDGLLLWGAEASQASALLLGGALELSRLPLPSGSWDHSGQCTLWSSVYDLLSTIVAVVRYNYYTSSYCEMQAWARERGLSDEWLDAALSAGVLRVPKPSRSEKNAGCDDRNVHATVKPVTLFAFLCTLACPRGGTVLDPFGGSGTTGVAAITCGMHWLLCEREAEYVAIAEARTAHAQQVSLQLQEAAE